MSVAPIRLPGREKEPPFDVEYVRNIISDLLSATPDEVESDHIEAKSWCRDEKELADKVSDACACLANSTGGYVFVGVAEGPSAGRRFSPCPHPGITRNWLTTHVQDLNRPPVECWTYDVSDLLSEVIGTPGCNLFAIHVPQKRCISAHVTHKGISKVRVGKECRTQFSAEDDRTKAFVPFASLEDLSVASIEWGMAQYQKLFKVSTQWSEHSDFLIQAQLAEPFLQDEEQSPRLRISLAAMLLFGKNVSLRRYVPFFETVAKTSRENIRLQQNIVESVRELCANDGVFKSLLPQIPADVVRELLVNAYVHRCYRLPGPVVINIAESALEIQSPGELAGGLKVDDLINCVPIYRNLLLSEAARYVGLCDKVGQGIDLVYKGVLESGLPFPEFESENDLFTARISLAGSEEFCECIRKRSPALHGLEEIIVLRLLWSRESATFEDLCAKMQRKSDSGSRVLEDMSKRMMIESIPGLSSYRLTATVRHDMETIFQSEQMSLESMWGYQRPGRP
jgi:predicted HTH transcriptional regulator